MKNGPGVFLLIVGREKSLTEKRFRENKVDKEWWMGKYWAVVVPERFIGDNAICSETVHIYIVDRSIFCDTQLNCSDAREDGRLGWHFKELENIYEMGW